jgi:sec-independent protein translocase protein TatA
MAGLTGWHLLILLTVVVILSGAKRLPEMARSLGQSARIFKGEIHDLTNHDPPSAGQHATQPATPTRVTPAPAGAPPAIPTTMAAPPVGDQTT